jgi:nitroimidazol reductase NimA-like FMN-containing flavoprotein (pyridoxamine 5'-phosphate oxidase superfamily)
VPEPSQGALADALDPTDRTTLRRKKERGTYDRALVHGILDEGLLCHVGFGAEGSTFVVPMAYARIGDTLYLHGATGNRMLRSLADGAEVCVTVTLLDALVLARSAFHHSMNYRSVMLFGVTTRVTDDEEKRRATTALLDHIAPGRSGDARPPSSEELRAVLMIRVPILEGSAKIRTGGPIDEPEDMGEPIWAGQIPVSVVSGAAVADEGLPPGLEVPSYARAYPPRRAQPATATESAPRPATTEPGG